MSNSIKIGYQLGISITLLVVILMIFTLPVFASKIIDIEQGARTSFIVKDDGTVWSWGQNFGGILNDGTMIDRCVLGPTRIVDVKKLAISDSGMVLKNDGTVWTWGINRYYTRGYDTSDNLSFSPISNMTDVKDIFASLVNCFAIKNDGTVWAWGWNEYGALGDGTTETRKFPVQISDLPKDIIMIAPAGGHTLALDSLGRVWAWGYNSLGQLGDGTCSDSYVPKLIQIDHVTQIAAGGSTSFALKNDGPVWSWGDNGVGQLGDGNSQIAYRNTPDQVKELTSVMKISSLKGNEVMAMKNDGTVWGWGYNALLLGDGTESFSHHIYSPKKLYITDAIDISCGDSHFVLKSDGSLWGWGPNRRGETGVGWINGLDEYYSDQGVLVPTRVLIEPGATPIPTLIPTRPPWLSPTPTPTPTPIPTTIPVNVTATPTQTASPTASPTVTDSPVTGTTTPDPSVQTPTGTPVPSQISGFDLSTITTLIGVVLVGNFLLSANKKNRK